MLSGASILLTLFTCLLLFGDCDDRTFLKEIFMNDFLLKFDKGLNVIMRNESQ